MIAAFATGRCPQIEYGAGSLVRLPDIAGRFGRRFLIVMGGRSFVGTPHWVRLQQALADAGNVFEVIQVSGEPSPEQVDQWVAGYRAFGAEVVIGIGGGSVLDAAKAIAGLLSPGNPVMDHLEGVGPEEPYCGPAIPFIAVPTTAGTGSEATRNAVLTRHGPNGFKKSFRDEKLVAAVAILDPDLLATCPPALIAANGMDALTQLLEAYVSIRANPMTDALALKGLQLVHEGLLAWYEGGDGAVEGRSRMSLAALFSGICLAQAGLGSVHGLAQPLGSFFPIPHGVVCGALVAPATQVNLTVLHSRAIDSPALSKYADIGRLFSGCNGLDDASAQDALVATLYDWTARMALPTLSALGVSRDDFPCIVANSRGSSMKTNPVVLTDAEIGEILNLRFH